MIATIETDTEFNGEDHFTPYTVGLDLNLPITSFLTFRAEAWLGQALTDVRGNVIQSINPLTGEEVWGYGGWAELRFQVTDRFLTVLGASIDDPENSDVPDGGRTSNFTAYLGLRSIDHRRADGASAAPIRSWRDTATSPAAPPDWRAYSIEGVIMLFRSGIFWCC